MSTFRGPAIEGFLRGARLVALHFDEAEALALAGEDVVRQVH